MFDFHDTHALIAQTLGLIAWLIGLTAATQKSDARLKSLYAIMCLVLAVHFGMLGAYVGMLTVMVTAVRNVVSIYAKKPWFAFIFIAFYVLAGFYKYQTPVDLLGTSAAILSTFAFFYLQNIRMRLVMLIVCSLWLGHNILTGSIGGTLLEMGNIILITWRTYKMQREQQSQKN